MENQRVLLFEDDPTMSSLLKTLLSMEGFHVDSYDNLDSDFVTYLENQKPDALIMDIHLRTHNGIEIARAIRSKPKLDGLKIIITSGMDKSRESLAVGANYFLLKPYMPDELIRILKLK